MRHPKVVGVIQARMGSTRLPGKILKPMCDGLPMIEVQYARMCESVLMSEVWMACSRPDEVAEIEQAMVRFHPQVICPCRHDPNDLIMRHLAIAIYTKADYIVRVPGHNPCAWGPDIDTVISNAVFFYPVMGKKSLFFSNINTRDTGAEVWPVESLHYLNGVVQDSVVREHPHRIQMTEDMEKEERAILFRLDVNTEEDYQFVKGIFDHFKDIYVSPDEIIRYVKQMKGAALGDLEERQDLS